MLEKKMEEGIKGIVGKLGKEIEDRKAEGEEWSRELERERRA